MSLVCLYWQFFFIGLITIGGGQVGITIMYDYIVGAGLLDAKVFYNMVAVAESTPGPVGINMATYIGTEMYGIIGGIITSIGVVTPSIIIIIVVSKFFPRFEETDFMQDVFKGVRPVVTALILVAFWLVFKISVIEDPFLLNKTWYTLFNYPSLLFFSLALIFMEKTKIPPIVYILSGAVFGIIFL